MKRRKLRFSIFLSLLLLVAMGIVFMNRYGDFFNVSRTASETNEIYTTEGTRQHSFTMHNSYLLIINNEEIRAIDKKGRNVFSTAFTARDPFVCSSGKYILLADRGGYEISVLENGNALFNITTDREIASANINSKGYFVVVTGETGYKGRLDVYGKDGQKRYEWKVGESHVIDADISSDGNLLAAVILAPDGDSVAGGITLVDMAREEVLARPIYKETIFSAVRFTAGGEFMAIGDTYTLGFNSSGVKKWDIEYHGRSLQTFDYKVGSSLALSFQNGRNTSTVEIYGTDGRKRGEHEMDYSAKGLDIQNDVTLVYGARSLGRLSRNGWVRSLVETSRDIRYSGFLPNKKDSFVVMGNTIYLMR